VFVSNEESTSTEPEHMRLFVERGKFVRCGPFSPPERGKKDARIEVFKAHAPITVPAALLLIERTRGRMGPALDFLRKCTLFTEGPIDKGLVDALVVPVATDDFISALVAFNGRDAMAAAPQILEEQYGFIIGALDYRLGNLSRLYRALRRADHRRDPSARRREVLKTSGLERFQVNELLPYARRYDPAQVRTCVQALALADSRAADGDTTLVLEVLTALWMTTPGST
jgi:hypothetical protein